MEAYDPAQRVYYLRNGLAALRRGDFFAAHEDWEIPWRHMLGWERRFWQALIQLSVGAYHHQNGNRTGCRNLWHKALRHCEALLSDAEAGRDNKPVLLLQKLLQECLEQEEKGECPLAAIQAFAVETVTEGWFEFR